tara:strand:+ start:78 stop:773 length:696 start_codon:yes stop_codon:yes gene_type:complete
MVFKDKLISGHFIKRYKRFFVDVKIGNNIITAHCPNTGSMMGLLEEGNKVWLSKSENPNRKLKFTLQIIKVKKTKVGINTHLTNKIVLDSLQAKEIKDFKNISLIKREVKFGENTRFDFLIINKSKKIFIEVKNVTLSRKKGIAEFPDAITSRGSKHIKELLKAKKKGYDICLFYVVQRDDVTKFELAKDIDPEYCELLMKAAKKKLKILCFDCKFSTKSIKLNREIKIKI